MYIIYEEGGRRNGSRRYILPPFFLSLPSCSFPRELRGLGERMAGPPNGLCTF